MAVSQTLSVTETSVNTTTNTSRVRILWQSTQSGGSYNDFTRTAYYFISINGGEEETYSVEYTLPKNGTENIVDVTITVPHRSDGTGTVSVRTWMDTGISAGLIQKSKTLNLTQISRASTITSAPSMTLGEACSVTWTPYSANLTYKLSFAMVGWSHTTGVILPNTTLPYTYTKYTLPLEEIAPKLPNNATGSMTVTLYTYSDSDGTVQVGYPSSFGASITVPENDETKPSIEMTLTPDTPYEKFSSLYLQGISKVKATFEGEGKYGASIVAYSLQAEDGRYTEAVAENTYISNVLSQSGESTIVGFVSDSRWFGNETIQKINVIAYDTPYISPSSNSNKVICERCDKDGKQDDSGTYLHVKGKINYTKIDTDGIVNTCRVKCRAKPEGANWSHNPGEGVDVPINTSTDEFDAILPNIVTDATRTYTIELIIIDDTFVPKGMVFNILTAEVEFHLRNGGRGAAFGKYAVEEDLFECAWDAKFHEGMSIHNTRMTDFVVEQGTSGIWEYRKWYSGKAECWGRSRATVDILTAWEAIYYGTVDGVAFPSGLFTEAPMCQVTPEYGGTMQIAWNAVGGEATSTSTPSMVFCRPNIAEGISFDILYYAIGKWK